MSDFCWEGIPFPTHCDRSYPAVQLVKVLRTMLVPHAVRVVIINNRFDN